MAVTRSNDFWILVRFQSHHIPALFSPVSDYSAEYRWMHATKKHFWYSEKPFISKRNEISSGILVYFSWACVFYILSCKNKNEIRLFMFSDVLGCSTYQVSLRNQLLRKRTWKKQNWASCSVTNFPQETKTKK